MLEHIGLRASAQQLADRAAIQEVLALHSRGLDRLESSILQFCYWQDAEVDYGSFKGSAHQFSEMVVQALAGSYELTRHCIGNNLIVFETDTTAKSECTVDAAHLLIGATEEMQFAGRYLDTLVKREGLWKMKHRKVVMDWSRTVQVADERESEAFSQLCKGRHGTADPSHTFFSHAFCNASN